MFRYFPTNYVWKLSVWTSHRNGCRRSARSKKCARPWWRRPSSPTRLVRSSFKMIFHKKQNVLPVQRKSASFKAGFFSVVVFSLLIAACGAGSVGSNDESVSHHCHSHQHGAEPDSWHGDSPVLRP